MPVGTALLQRAVHMSTTSSAHRATSADRHNVADNKGRKHGCRAAAKIRLSHQGVMALLSSL